VAAFLDADGSNATWHRKTSDSPSTFVIVCPDTPLEKFQFNNFPSPISRAFWRSDGKVYNILGLPTAEVLLLLLLLLMSVLLSTTHPWAHQSNSDQPLLPVQSSKAYYFAATSFFGKRPILVTTNGTGTTCSFKPQCALFIVDLLQLRAGV